MRMERLSRVVGLVTVLVALPLLCVAWLLAGSLAGLLMLNERRLLGLMRLRGVPGEVMGRVLLVAVIAGGTIGGIAGLIAGSVGTLAVYERGRVPLSVLLTPTQVIAAIQLVVVTVALAFFVSRRLVRYATTISPLEAARRVETSEAARAGLRFGWLQLIALAIGAYVLVSWMAPRAAVFTSIPIMGRVLDFIGMPLFVYGIAVLLTSRQRQMQAAVSPMARLAAGTLGPLAEKHIAVKPHRTLAFLLIVALMVSVSLYPLITSGSFEEKAARGARVQIGADWQLLFNSPDLTDVTRLQGSLGEQRDALREPIERLASQVAAVGGVTGVTYLIEALLPNIYLPDYGLRGVPAYLVGDRAKYLATVYSEPELGMTDPFDRLTERLGAGEVVVSQTVAQFKKLTPGSRLRLGVDGSRRGVVATTGGVVAQLPGIPARSVTDRQGYVEARIDYLNHLFSNNAYVVASADNPLLAPMHVVIPRVILLVKAPGTTPDEFRQRLMAALPFTPLEIHSLDEEVSKVASDMYISLVLANIRIYLVGGLVLALVAIVSVSAANYVEDRRTLALLRIRGASPRQLWRFMLALLLSPAVVGLAIGAGVAVLAGYGLANHVWDLREIKTVVQLLDTRLVLSPAIGTVAALLVGLLVAAVSAFSWWVFQRTAHRTLQET
jgi:FtsX-like permease family